MKNSIMIKTVHRKLTLLCSGITIFIMIVMSFGYLSISEKSLKDNQFLAFQTSMNTFIANLQQQSVITHDWLLSAESTGNFYLQIKDNGEDFLFNTLNSDTSKDVLFDYARSFYHSHFQIVSLGSPKPSEHIEFAFSYERKNYYGCLAYLYKGNAVLETLIIFPLTGLNQQIIKQRILFLWVNLVFAMIFILFSSYFTKKLLKPVEENHKSQIQFIAAASHELRTPLSVILSCADACQKADSKDITIFLSTIRQESVHMSRLINDMLTLTKTDMHTFSIHKETLEPDILLLNSFEAFEAISKEKKRNLSVSLPEETYPSCQLDKERILQVLAILIDNALTYTRIGGDISLSLKNDGKYILYIVEDNGIGIADEEKKAIFNRFYRANSSRNEKEHFGLGLSIALEIIQEHHGTIFVTDTPGGGSTFTVRLPIA